MHTHIEAYSYIQKLFTLRDAADPAFRVVCVKYLKTVFLEFWWYFFDDFGAIWEQIWSDFGDFLGLGGTLEHQICSKALKMGA